MESVLITGGSGLIGSYLTRLLLDKGFRVSHLTRDPHRVHLSSVRQFRWDPNEKYIEPAALEHDYIIHLAGADISEKRWTNDRKKILYESRVGTAALLTERILQAENKPKAYISASATGYYGAVTGLHPFKEEDRSGTDFLAKLCVEWERVATPLAQNNIRTVFIRTPFVLSPVGGGLSKLLKAAQYSILAQLGTGKQIMPWVHITDIVNAYYFAMTNDKMRGAFNVVSDDLKTNREFTACIYKHLGKKQLLPGVPELILRIGIGELAKTLTHGSPVSNERIKKYGFDFLYETLSHALKDCIDMKSQKAD